MSSGSHTKLTVIEKEISLSGSLSKIFLLYIMTLELLNSLHSISVVDSLVTLYIM